LSVPEIRNQEVEKPVNYPELYHKRLTNPVAEEKNLPVAGYAGERPVIKLEGSIS